jgi:hypothetical protein
MRRLLTGLALSGALIIASLAPAVAAPKAFDEAGFGKANDTYQANNPHDWSGLSRLWARYGVQMLSVSDQQYGIERATPAQADALIASASGGVTTYGLSSSDFSVTGAIGYITSTGEYLVQGQWNFRDDFVNGSDPDDIALLSVRSNCYKIRGTYWTIYDYQNNLYTSLGYIKKAEVDGDVAVGIDDKTSGFRLLNDHGNVRHFMRSKGSCYTRDFTAAFAYEHNQDGGSLGGLSLSLGVISVSYGGSPAVFEKSTGLFS